MGGKVCYMPDQPQHIGQHTADVYTYTMINCSTKVQNGEKLVVCVIIYIEDHCSINKCQCTC